MDNNDFAHRDVMERLAMLWESISLVLDLMPLPITLPPFFVNEQEVNDADVIRKAAQRTIELALDLPVSTNLQAAIRSTLVHWLTASFMIGAYGETQTPWYLYSAMLNAEHCGKGLTVMVHEVAAIADED